MTTVKINLISGKRIGFASLLLASVMISVGAETPARSRGTPIIFSAPSNSDTVSSNLNELRAPAAPLRELEAGFKKPFEAMDPLRGSKAPKPLARPAQPPQQPEMNRRTLKDQMNQRAEQMFLNPELFEGEDDPYQLSDSGRDPFQTKPRTDLDRYYDRLDRNRVALTNRAPSNDLFEQKKPDVFGDRPSGNGLDADLSAARTLTLMSNSSAGSAGFFNDRIKVAPHSSAPFGISSDDPAFARNLSPQETRRDNFQRLLEGSSYQPRVNPAAPVASYGTAPATPKTTPSYSWSSSAEKPASTATPATTFATSAGLVGNPSQPQGIPEWSPTTSLSTPPPAAAAVKPLPPPKFNPPQRRF